jgi:pimeloyl-ACP methyl ester carboxylesterase
MTYIRFVAAVSVTALLWPGGIAYAQRPAESATASSQAVVPFRIHVPDRVLTDLPVDTTSAEARKVAEARYNVVHFTTMPRGGHFPAFEQPKLWLGDIRAFFATVRKTQH